MVCMYKTQVYVYDTSVCVADAVTKSSGYRYGWKEDSNDNK